MTVKHMVIHDCVRVRIQSDPENGCLDIEFFGDQERKSTFKIMAFGADDTPPGIDLAEPVQPESDEDE